MSTSLSLSFSYLFCFIIILFCPSSSVIVEAKVPISKTFKSVNQGLLLSGNVEYNANYRLLNISNYPFRICFYNSTPNAYFLGIGMGNTKYISLMRWVWTANRSRPVTDKAKLIFARDGNLVLVDANGKVAWQTYTANNKGVVDIKLLPNGNLVLLNKAGAFVWQSFDHPTDTLLIGQSLIPGQSLVNGAYSMVVDKKEVKLYFKSAFSSKPFYYHILSYSQFDNPEGDVPNSGFRPEDIQKFIFRIAPNTDGPDHANELRLDRIDDFLDPTVLAHPKYNCTLSMLRFSSDGNIHVYSYYEMGVRVAWEETYTLFTNSDDYRSEGKCILPEKCGSFGLCENGQCVACPTVKGLRGWSKDCKPIKKKLPCNNVVAKAANLTSYYKIEGVGFLFDSNNYIELPKSTTIEECKKECSNDCKCVAFMYKPGWPSPCLLAYEISYTLINYHWHEAAAYIKYAK